MPDHSHENPTAGLGLPGHVQACLFDLDGVLTPTAKMHAAAWKETFDRFLRDRARTSGEPFVPFDPAGDYERYVDGEPRAAGTRSFLAARGIRLSEGAPDDPPGTPTILGLGNAKNDVFVRLLGQHGVTPYEGSAHYLRAVRRAGLRTAVVSSSNHCRPVLQAARIVDQFDVIIDGFAARERRLAGKPAPDTYLAAARDLGVVPDVGAVFEDALAGVDAGRAGGFAYVVGVDRSGQSGELRRHGADIVVPDLEMLLRAP